VKNLKIKPKNLVYTPTNTLIAILIFLILIYWILKPSLLEGVLTTLFGAILTVLVGIYSEKIKTEIKIRELKPAILLELRYVLISLIENFARFYVVYYEYLKLYDLSRLFELIEKHKKDFPNYLIDELSPCVILYESGHKIYQENIKKITLEVKKWLKNQIRKEDVNFWYS
jgi:hypothetical protein